jgi:hypothetical protein
MSIAEFNDVFNRNLGFLRANNAIGNLLKITLLIYGGVAAPKIADKYRAYFQTPYARLAIMALVMWTVDYDVGVAIVLAVLFILSIGKWSPDAQKAPVTVAVPTVPGGNAPGGGKPHSTEYKDGPQAYVPDDVLMLASAEP